MNQTTNTAGIDLDHLEALARAATPQNFDSAQTKRVGGWGECPTCGGDGSVTIGNDYCDYDMAAQGVQFYGVGDAHVKTEAFYRAANPATVLQLIQLARRSTSGSERAGELPPPKYPSMKVLEYGERSVQCGYTAEQMRAALTGQATGAVCQPLADERAKFETWGVGIDLFTPEALQRGTDDEYVSDNTNSLWFVWQASAQQASGSDGTAAARAVDALDGMGYTYDREIGWLPPKDRQATSGSELADERALFQREALRRNIVDEDGLERRASGEYVDEPAQAAWDAWQARAALAQQAGAHATPDAFVASVLGKLDLYGIAASDGNDDARLRIRGDISDALWAYAAPAPAAQDAHPHHFACERKGYNPLCAGCDAEKAAQDERDAKDAARYRWLRDADPDIPRDIDVCDDCMNIVEGKTLDAAIDAAMSQSKTQGAA